MFGRLFGKKDPLPGAASRMLEQVVSESRKALHYRDGGVPDTLEGRFEMMVVSAFPIFYRLKGQGKAAERLAQLLFDSMFREIDMSLREMGVGDLSVPRKIKAMAQGFYGRVVAYERALDAEDAAALREAVTRNVFSSIEGTPDDKSVDYVVDLIKSNFARIGKQPFEDIMAGKLAYDGSESRQAA